MEEARRGLGAAEAELAAFRYWMTVDVRRRVEAGADAEAVCFGLGCELADDGLAGRERGLVLALTEAGDG